MADQPIRGAIIAELWVAARYSSELLDRTFEEAGESTDDYGPLSYLGFMQPITRTRLAEATGLRRTTVRDMVARSIEKGHVEERPNPTDGRSTLISLTPEGQAIFDRGLPLFKKVLNAIAEALDGDLYDHEDAVRRVRIAVQSLVD